MKTLKFSVHIASPREVVWNVLWGDEPYRKWASVFHGDTYAVTDWKEGSKIVFMSPNGEGKNSVILRKVPNEFMSFQHIDTLREAAYQTIDEHNPEWQGAFENYYLHEEDGVTMLKVEVETTEDAVKYFEANFPLALKKVKDMAEALQPHRVY